MKCLKYTLLCDGSSDRALIPIINWLFKEHFEHIPVQAEWADLYRLPQRPASLAERIDKALDYYPCDVLFIHRDAEAEPRLQRANEIGQAVKSMESQLGHFLSIPVIPVRMTEAWLLFDEEAIRTAASNPQGKIPLNLPPAKTVEDCPDPKELLYTALKSASELSGRRLKKFRPSERVHRVANLIANFSPLRVVPAFQRLETEIKALCLPFVS